MIQPNICSSHGAWRCSFQASPRSSHAYLHYPPLTSVPCRLYRFSRAQTASCPIGSHQQLSLNVQGAELPSFLPDLPLDPCSVPQLPVLFSLHESSSAAVTRDSGSVCLPTLPPSGSSEESSLAPRPGIPSPSQVPRSVSRSLVQCPEAMHSHPHRPWMAPGSREGVLFHL